MRAIEFLEEPLDETPGVPLANGLTISEDIFPDFEPTVSQKILGWISEKSWVAPAGMSIIAVVSTANPRVRSGPWHYGEGVYAPVNGTKRVLSNNHFNIWLCDDDFLVFRIAPVFHYEIVGFTMSNEVKNNFKERILQNLIQEGKVIHLKTVNLHQEQHRLEARRKVLAELYPIHKGFQF